MDDYIDDFWTTEDQIDDLDIPTVDELDELDFLLEVA